MSALIVSQGEIFASLERQINKSRRVGRRCFRFWNVYKNRIFSINIQMLVFVCSVVEHAEHTHTHTCRKHASYVIIHNGVKGKCAEIFLFFFWFIRIFFLFILVAVLVWISSWLLFTKISVSRKLLTGGRFPYFQCVHHLAEVREM